MITNADIEYAQQAATQVRNHLLADYCRKALEGNPTARARVEQVIIDAQNARSLVVDRPKLGRRQRFVLSDLADRGRWSWAARRWSPSATATVMESLRARRLVAVREDTMGGGAWALTTDGYTWLIGQAVDDLTWVPPESTHYDRVASRVGHLVALCALASAGPVNWKGELV
jgi:hypothetical protein